MNLKEKLKDVKMTAVGVATALPAVMMMSVPAFAADTSSVSAVMGTALTGVSDEFKATVAVIAPIGIGITAVFLIWKYGLRFFKDVSGKNT